SNGPRVKKFNLTTYKFHAMGDYIRTIRLFGTTDSFTTQIGELAHRALKAFYPLTSKKDTHSQLARQEHCRHILRRVAEAGVLSASSNKLSINTLPSTSGVTVHSIGTNQNKPIKLFTFLGEHAGDPALKEFILKLKNHILYCLQKLDIDYCDHTFTEEERNTVIISNNTIYSVQT
ncbi:uncharacterized protein EDB93DRAFT_1065245, partial [Suillus bovinus]|uniref:uncharacterized protein n=1 Tax=Suillus bovinus TaxID=48563 RepID=UPI001B882EB2